MVELLWSLLLNPHAVNVFDIIGRISVSGTNALPSITSLRIPPRNSLGTL